MTPALTRIPASCARSMRRAASFSASETDLLLFFRLWVSLADTKIPTWGTRQRMALSRPLPLRMSAE